MKLKYSKIPEEEVCLVCPKAVAQVTLGLPSLRHVTWRPMKTNSKSLFFVHDDGTASLAIRWNDKETSVAACLSW